MDFKTLFFSWNGRSARKPYWVGIVAVELLAFVLSFVFALARLGEAGTLLAALIMAYPRICVISKRFHDFNRSGWWQVLPNILGTMATRGAQAMAGIGGNLALAGFLYILAVVIEFGFLIWLGSVKGQPRTNDFGPPPGQADVVEVF
ncbi:MAG TPA: DUF805 domain-containing protein [Caulobacteraceae bacterium]|nr:DUF805 domain-containing protein [Caulobacteraceae bacterium]